MAPQVGLEPTTPSVNRVALICVNKYSLQVTQGLVWSLLVVSFRKTGTNKMPAVFGSYMLLVVFFPSIDEVSILIGISFAVNLSTIRPFRAPVFAMT